MIQIHHILLTILIYLLASCSSNTPPTSIPTWDAILVPRLFADIANFEKDTHEKNNDRIFVFSAPKKAGGILVSITVAVAPSGKWLDIRKWKKAYNTANLDQKEKEFPSIGARAQTQPASFSPTGVLTKVIYTTEDNKYDILVSVYEASNQELTTPITAIDAALRIDDAYHKNINYISK